MTVLAYLLVPVLVVAIAASITWARNRQPTSLQSGVDSFRREMDALSPDADPRNRRRAEPGGSRPASGPRPGPPRRAHGPDEDA
ncbi:MAG: hypothetical protein KF703_02360 [Actinobacteria bacterium]|nr:hypothetical protein [Actinomycetota bacterium]